MKKLFGLVLLMLLLVAATDFTPSEPEALHTIEGTWELVGFYNYDDGVEVSDTVPKDEGYRQGKMYYNGKIMWSRYVPDEPNGRFGYGS